MGAAPSACTVQTSARATRKALLVSSLLCSLHCLWLGSSACCLAHCPTDCSANCYAYLLIELIVGIMHCSTHRCARLLIALLICLLCFLFLGSCASYPLLAWLVRIWSVCYLVHCSTHALPLCSLLCSFALHFSGSGFVLGLVWGFWCIVAAFAPGKP